MVVYVITCSCGYAGTRSGGKRGMSPKRDALRLAARFGRNAGHRAKVTKHNYK